MNEVIHPKPAYEKPTIEVLGSVARLTQFTFNPNKWSSWADLVQGIDNAIDNGGVGS